MMRVRLGLWVSLLILLGACDGSADAGDVAAACTEQCNWRARCGKGEADCVIKCQTRVANVYMNYRASTFTAAAECFSTLACGESDDSCGYAALRGVNILSESVYQECMAVRATCRAADQPTFSDDHCVDLLLLVDGAQDAAADCYRLPCDQMNSCLKAVRG